MKTPTPTASRPAPSTATSPTMTAGDGRSPGRPPSACAPARGADIATGETLGVSLMPNGGAAKRGSGAWRFGALDSARAGGTIEGTEARGSVTAPMPRDGVTRGGGGGGGGTLGALADTMAVGSNNGGGDCVSPSTGARSDGKADAGGIDARDTRDGGGGSGGGIDERDTRDDGGGRGGGIDERDARDDGGGRGGGVDERDARDADGGGHVKVPGEVPMLSISMSMELSSSISSSAGEVGLETERRVGGIASGSTSASSARRSTVSVTSLGSSGSMTT